MRVIRHLPSRIAPALSVRNDQQDDHDHNAPRLARQRPENAEEKNRAKICPAGLPGIPGGDGETSNIFTTGTPGGPSSPPPHPFGCQFDGARPTSSRTYAPNSGRLASHSCGGHAPHTRYALPQSVHRVSPRPSGPPGSPQPWHVSTSPRLPHTPSLLCRRAAGEGRRYPAAPVRTPHAPAGHSASVPWGAHVSRRDGRGVPVPGGPWCAPLTRSATMATFGSAVWFQGVEQVEPKKLRSPKMHSHGSSTETPPIPIGHAPSSGVQQ